MCTVTYLPLGGKAYILTSNRDEDPQRKSSLPPDRYVIHNNELFFPKDQEAEGTWITAESSQYTVCLLNGAFTPHEKKESYRMSRGLALLDFFKYKDVVQYASNYFFSDIQPFTLIIVQHEPDLTVHELRWDGNKVHLLQKDNTMPAIWSSVTLYDDDIIRQREGWFDQWLTDFPVFTVEEIMKFHRTGGKGDPFNDFLMNRNDEVRTLSITSVYRNIAVQEMIYEDVINDLHYHTPLDIGAPKDLPA